MRRSCSASVLPSVYGGVGPLAVISASDTSMLLASRHIDGQKEMAKLASEKLGAEENGFALEHFDGEEESDGGVDAGGEENEGDKIPVIGAGDEFFAEQAHVDNRDEGQFGSEFDARDNARNGGDDDDHAHGGQVALRFFITLGEKRDGHEHGGEKDCDGQSQYENRKDRPRVNAQDCEPFTVFLGRGESRDKRECSPHREDRKRSGGQGGGQDKEKLPEYKVPALCGAGEDGFHSAALFFASRQVHCRVHRAGHAHKNDKIGNEAAVEFASDLFGGDDVLLFRLERFHQAFG